MVEISNFVARRFGLNHHVNVDMALRGSGHSFRHVQNIVDRALLGIPPGQIPIPFVRVVMSESMCFTSFWISLRWRKMLQRKRLLVTWHPKKRHYSSFFLSPWSCGMRSDPIKQTNIFLKGFEETFLFRERKKKKSPW